MEFIKKEKNDNSVEFRIKFGRDKAAVMSKGGKYFYVNLYDNRAKYKGNHIFFGFDELEELTKIIEAMNNLKSEFSEHNMAATYIPNTEEVSPAPYVAEMLNTKQATPLNTKQATQLNSMQVTPLKPINKKDVITGKKRKGIMESGIPCKKVKFNEENNKITTIPSLTSAVYQLENFPPELFEDFKM